MRHRVVKGICFGVRQVLVAIPPILNSYRVVWDRQLSFPLWHLSFLVSIGRSAESPQSRRVLWGWM